MTDTPRSYRPEFIADSSGTWAGNALRFATAEEAEWYAADLARRWTLVRETRVVPSDDAVTYEIKDNRLVPVRY
jgi:hypothetical protein